MQYAMDRETFGKPLIEHEVIRSKFSEMGRQIEAHWAWLEQLAYHIHTEGPQAWASPEIGSRLALGKVMAGQNLEKAVREAQQIFGGAGYQRGKGAGRVVEQISRDFRMMVVGGGSEEIISDMAVRMEVANCKRKGARL
jgi:alkylation response protein AidB-like acyl-CoA dehydrogenase